MNLLLILAVVIWLVGWGANVVLANGPHSETRAVKIAVPVIFGVTLLVLWELIVRGYDVPSVILPLPTAIWSAFSSNRFILWADFVQTIVKGGLTGFAIACVLASVTAVFVDRSDFLRRGLLPVANFVAALPVVGIAPIFVMWFGFGWGSKAAVVVAMTFFIMLLNIVAGLNDTTAMQRDLMRTYGAGYWRTLIKLRLPASAPFVFNGLRVAITLSLVGAIVAEFFGSPTVGLGYRISTSVGQLALDMVWSAILVAALAGSILYGLLVLVEKAITFWHPSQRS